MLPGITVSSSFIHNLLPISFSARKSRFMESSSSLCFQQAFILTITYSVFLSFTIPFARSLSFKLERFDPKSDSILHQGDAVNSVGSIEFNLVNYINRVGLVTYKEEVRIWDQDTGTLSDFNTHFTFFIDTLNQSTYGHGLTFFMAPVNFQIPPNSGGGFLGLFNTTTSFSPHNQMIVVEFDSFPNPEWDPTFEHVGINNNSISSAKYAPWNASLHSGDTADAWIVYDATTMNLTVYWSYRDDPDYAKNSSLSYEIDLSKVLPEWVVIGFSAATGMYVERHNLQYWEFNSKLDTKVAPGNNVKLKLTIGLVVPLCFLLVVGVVGTLVYRRKRRLMMRKQRAEADGTTSFNDELERGAGPRKFSRRELAAATKDFSDDRKLGEGGFGAVYKGYLIDLDVAVAVKKISRGSKQGKLQYVTEVKIISRLRHRNLVQLIGWCHDHGEFLLVYELMPNGSLDAHLFGKKTPLSWPVRYKIALGLASALLYLHEEWEQCVVHRDIKSSNVMLDSSFNVKLGDFGLARLMDHELGAETTNLAGTWGYMAPEYITTRKASKESDVFSFGIVSLEIATGKKVHDPLTEDLQYQRGLVEWVWNYYGKGELTSAVDQRLHTEFDAREVERLMVVGLWCAHPDRDLRPSIKQAIHVLNLEAPMPTLPTSMPVVVYSVPNPSITSTDPSLTATSLEVGR